MATLAQHVRMVPVDATLIESVGYADSTRNLYIKFRDTRVVCFEGMPRFRFQGLMSAVRKDAYYTTFIKNHFLAKAVDGPP